MATLEEGWLAAGTAVFPPKAGMPLAGDNRVAGLLPKTRLAELGWPSTDWLLPADAAAVPNEMLWGCREGAACAGDPQGEVGFACCRVDCAGLAGPEDARPCPNVKGAGAGCATAAEAAPCRIRKRQASWASIHEPGAQMLQLPRTSWQALIGRWAVP